MLNAPVHTLKGIGEKYSEELATLNIFTIQDLLFYFPYRYETYEIKPIHEWIHGDQITLVGEVVHAPSLQYYSRNKSRLSFTIKTENVAIKAVIFNRAFLKKQIHIGDTYTLTGKWDMQRMQITVQTVKKGIPKRRVELESFYTVKGNITNKRLKQSIQTAFKQYGDKINEILPSNYLQMYKLPERKNALKIMHFPPDRKSLKHAKRRFTYEELLIFQLKMQHLKQSEKRTLTGNKQPFDIKKVEAFMQQLPFTLTNAQQQALSEILTDMKSPYRMNRLLQGDVGSGKTVVAAISLYATVTAYKQGVIMVPTEILAEQHYESLKKTLKDRAQIALLTSSIRGKKREELLNDLKTNRLNIIIGTHALIQEDVVFHDLGLVIVDEQHRFGVEQRRILRDKGLEPDVLFMTATPIPRTLAITAFGDMDVSIIDEMPSGRKEVKTYWVKENMIERILQFILKRIKKGEQAYFVCPLIEESEKLDFQNAVDLYEQLQTYFPETVKIGLMHGRLSADDKDKLMQQFIQNDVQILVSTTVIEVGVNVPNATIMVVYDAERFGLSQLHQLRGRVGRGNKQSYCILIADPKGDTGKERMKIMTETTDGFELSEHDLKLRGPGDFFGSKQSGLPEFKVADIVHDYRALETARKDAVEIISKQLLENDDQFKDLKQLVEEQTGTILA